MDYIKLEADIKKHIESCWKRDQHRENYCFHNVGHTEDVVRACKEMAAHYYLSERETFVLVASAYFHDIGYLHGGVEGHEKRGADMAQQYLSGQIEDQDLIKKIRSCILTTRLIDGKTNPQNLLEQIICDADLFHFGTKQFFERDRLMHRETENVWKLSVENAKWLARTIEILKRHRYYTTYAQDLLNDQKQKNVTILEEYLNKEEGGILPTESQGKKKKKKDAEKPERGIETMFRVTSTNNQRLSDMADNKANIMITVNSIIISLVIGLLMSKLDKNPHLTIPTFVLLISCLATVITSILATRPKIPSGRFTPDEVSNKSVNLLFFGNFYRMPLESYTDGMLKVMEDRDFLYRMLIKDVYSQGIVLGRKYRLLRLSYNFFMFGLIISIIGFSLTFLFIDEF